MDWITDNSSLRGKVEISTAQVLHNQQLLRSLAADWNRLRDVDQQWRRLGRWSWRALVLVIALGLLAVASGCNRPNRFWCMHALSEMRSTETCLRLAGCVTRPDEIGRLERQRAYVRMCSDRGLLNPDSLAYEMGKL